MRKKISSILAVMLSAAIGITGISASAAASEEYDAFLEASVKTMSVEAENKEVYFYYDTVEESDSFKLYENGIEVGTFVDDGKYSVSGDDIMGDGVYTLKYSIDTDTIPEGSKHFDNVYHVRNGNAIVSDDETISVYKPFTQQELDDMNLVDEDVKKLIESDEYTASYLEERKVLVTELLNFLAEQGLVKSNFTFSNTVAGFEYSCGVQGAIMLKGWDEYEEPIDSPAVTTAVTTTPVETTTTISITPIVSVSYTVLYESGMAISLESKPNKLNYNIGEELDLTGLTVNLTESRPDGSSKEIYSNVNPFDYPDAFTVDTSEFDNTKAGEYTIKVNYNYYSGFFCPYASFKVTVEDEGEAVTTTVTTEPVETTTTTTVTTTTTTTTATTQLVGDANGDNEVNVRDCADIASALAKGNISKLQKSADFNGDGKIDVRDAAAIAKILANKNSMESWEYAYNSLINGKSSNTERSYSLVYIDEDDVPELIVTDIGDNRDGGVYTYKNGILNELEGISLRNNIYGYSEKSGIFAMKWLWLEQAGYNFYKLENGAIEKVHEFVVILTTEGEAESFSVDGQNVTEEEYNQLYEEYSINFKDVVYCGYDEVYNQLN